MINKIDRNLLNSINILGEHAKQYCIVRFDSDACAKKYIQENNLDTYNYYSFINSVVTNLTFKNMYKLASKQDVVYISSVSKVCTLVNVAKQIIGVNNPNDETASFSIAVIDTGVYPHLDFTLGRHCNIISFVDLINGKTRLYDDNGHGTFVTSLICGNGTVSGSKYSGIDYNNNIVVIKALDSDGETNALTILSAMQYIYDNREKYNIKIVCMSFGSNVLDKDDPLVLGAEALWNAGVCVVCACGNSGPDAETIKSPSASSRVISVGALQDNRVGDVYNKNMFEVAQFSSRGPVFGNYKPDVIVSGVDVISACNFHINKTHYTKMSGTSVATPIVAGVVAKLIKKYPNHSPDQIKKILINNCNQLTGDRNVEGYGWLNLEKIL